MIDLDLFAGAGGLDEGLRLLGELLGVAWQHLATGRAA